MRTHPAPPACAVNRPSFDEEEREYQQQQVLTYSCDTRITPYSCSSSCSRLSHDGSRNTRQRQCLSRYGSRNATQRRCRTSLALEAQASPLHVAERVSAIQLRHTHANLLLHCDLTALCCPPSSTRICSYYALLLLPLLPVPSSLPYCPLPPLPPYSRCCRRRSRCWPRRSPTRSSSATAGCGGSRRSQPLPRAGESPNPKATAPHTAPGCFV